MKRDKDNRLWGVRISLSNLFYFHLKQGFAGLELKSLSFLSAGIRGAAAIPSSYFLLSNRQHCRPQLSQGACKLHCLLLHISTLSGISEQPILSNAEQSLSIPEASRE